MVLGLGHHDVNHTDVIQACQRGDGEAFRVLFETHKDRVYSIALRYAGDSAAAMDISQDTFLKLLSSIGQFRGDANFESWLYRLVVNACMDGARRAKPQRLEAAGFEVDGLAGPDSPERDLAQQQRARSVRAALSAMPVKFRLPILLRYFEELSYSEMAAALNCSMGTVASRLNRGHKMLAGKLESLR